jgi:hypothetical protein
MKSLNLFSFILIAATVFTSCQKEVNSTPPATQALPKTYTETITSTIIDNSSTTYNLTYDGSNRLTSLISVSDPGNKFIYQYSDASYTLDLYEGGTVAIHEIFFINSNIGLIDSTFQYNNTNDSMTEKYLYNQAKQPVSYKEYNYSVVTGAVLFNTSAYTYDNTGNMISVTDTNSVTTNTYYTDYLTSFSLSGIYSFQNKNLVKTTTYTSGGDTVSLTHTYTFDSSNRLTVDSALGSNGDLFVKTYTY